jgi:formylglycine-generating enzyme required for sulfatase activity
MWTVESRAQLKEWIMSTSHSPEERPETEFKLRRWLPVAVVIVMLLLGVLVAPSLINILNPTIAPGYRGGTLITANSQWTPVTQEFGGVTMVLVPAGCFDMGNDPDADGGDENGGHICFDEPFWIDQTEVRDRLKSRFL